MENNNNKLLTKEEVLKIFKEEGSYLSVPEDYREGMIIDETSKVIRDSILSENNNDVEKTLEDLKKLDEFENKFNRSTRQEKEEENLIKALAQVYDPEDYTSKKEHARLLNLDGYIKRMSGIFHTIYRHQFDKYPKIEFMKHYVEHYQRYYNDMRQLMEFYEYRLKSGCTQEELDLTKKDIEDILNKHIDNVKLLFNKFYEKMENKNG